MPIYEYHCEKCDKSFEKIVFRGEEEQVRACGAVALSMRALCLVYLLVDRPRIEAPSGLAASTSSFILRFFPLSAIGWRSERGAREPPCCQRVACMVRFASHLLFVVSGEAGVMPVALGAHDLKFVAVELMHAHRLAAGRATHPHQDPPPPRCRGWAAPRVGKPSVVRRSTKPTAGEATRSDAQ